MSGELRDSLKKLIVTLGNDQIKTRYRVGLNQPQGEDTMEISETSRLLESLYT